MDQSRIIRCFIDWGYTRLKVWICNDQGSLLFEDSTYTASLAKDPSFYDSEDIDKACRLIKKILLSCLPAKAIHIYTCSQMHALAGILDHDFPFLSTWNDLPNGKPLAEFVAIANGIPILNSMPVNKVCREHDSVYLRSSHDSLANKLPSLITALTSPINLLLQRIFQISLPCSMSWWQSTCLPKSTLKLNASNQSCYISERPLRLEIGKAKALFGVDVDIVIFPEVGDLQASTYNHIRECQLLLNLGTGSQLIFPTLPVSTTLPYFRFYNQELNSVPVISHIPCGRLLSDYVTYTGIPFNLLRDTLVNLQASDILSLEHSSKKSLLCFPGFSYHDCAYHQQPLTSIEELAKLDPSQFLSLWISQYLVVIEHFFPKDLPINALVLVGIVGELGGVAEGFRSLLSTLLPPRFLVSSLPSLAVPQSLLRLHEDGGAHG
jgi:hypothetical protein